MRVRVPRRSPLFDAGVERALAVAERALRRITGRRGLKQEDDEDTNPRPIASSKDDDPEPPAAAAEGRESDRAGRKRASLAS
jgi:hypothetical protein